MQHWALKVGGRELGMMRFAELSEELLSNGTLTGKATVIMRYVICHQHVQVVVLDLLYKRRDL